MAVSHSFAGEHVEDRSDEKGSAERDHHDIKHRGYPERVETCGRRGAAGTEPEMARAFNLPTHCPARMRPIFEPESSGHGSNALPRIKIRGASVCANISKP